MRKNMCSAFVLALSLMLPVSVPTPAHAQEVDIHVGSSLNFGELLYCLRAGEAEEDVCYEPVDTLRARPNAREVRGETSVVREVGSPRTSEAKTRHSESCSIARRIARPSLHRNRPYGAIA